MKPSTINQPPSTKPCSLHVTNLGPREALFHAIATGLVQPAHAPPAYIRVGVRLIYGAT